MTTLGLYVSVPFCRAKCSFCNFSSGVWGAAEMGGYVRRVVAEVAEARAHAERLGCDLPVEVDSVYFGGGTPSLLEPMQVAELFAALRGEFHLQPEAEITLECAPGQLPDEALAAWRAGGTNRVSLGVQSFLDAESAAVGRLHTGALCRAEIARLLPVFGGRVGLDLICGLPHQTAASWQRSVDEAVRSGVDHVSVYMLEVDEGSRLGREALEGGQRYGAGALPAEDDVADWYSLACGWLGAAGLGQYEISNFGRPSRHNTRYWQREPYLGFGLDAHSMLHTAGGAVRWSNPDTLHAYTGQALGSRGWDRTLDRVDQTASFEEALFLGLRMTRGVSLPALRAEFPDLADALPLDDLIEAGLLRQDGATIALTERGRMASNEVFSRLLL